MEVPVVIPEPNGKCHRCGAEIDEYVKEYNRYCYPCIEKLDNRKATVAELIEQLQQIQDKSLPVILEGCDCLDFTGGDWYIRERGKEKVVILKRAGKYEEHVD